ncbi:DUF3999 domain-containing protein [Paraburkholderia phenoliruptrix]|uniref:DUF3999 domain-containing protein n=2 Tax=Paraburkholderia phenoliruptrix TaxID=252970 RepID=A0A6J5K3M8_9BURK|nr:DUF3999 domain-containing protein [Paraburkholderia phenoliruptrix]AFT85797.1 transmembrane protein [Paraburkholderia phenoliruptrix BR3459a]MDR6392198.1 hypothetical protein [Paraburkholderia phenoliruptrix]CAB4048317.1 hypothetical protein LMG9964_01953 [Paraburkholderia phenoliruptrix]
MKHLLKRTGWCVALVSAYAAAPACAEDFARRFALQLDEGAAYYSVTVPAAVYAASQRNDLGDLRIFNGAGEPVPYSLEAPREPARTPPSLHPVRWFPLRPAPAGQAGAPLGVTIAADGSLRATAAPPGRAQHDTDLIDAGAASHEGRASALLVHLRDDNYQGRVSVESSDDLRNWQPAGDAQLLKVSYNGSTLSQDRIELNGAHARYLRLHWLDGAPFLESIDVEVQAAGAGRAQLADSRREWREGIVAQAGPKAGEYFFSTGGPYPVDRLRLDLPQPNTVAPAVVYSRGELGGAWREVSSATLFRLHNGAVEQNNPSLQLTPDTDRHWRVVVDTRNGGLGSGALTVAAGWRPATLTFVARGSAPFTLGVGSASAVSTAVGRDELLMGASSVIATARVGEALALAQNGNGLAPANADAYRRYVLWAALLLAVGSLGAIAWRLARSVSHRVPAGDGAGVSSVPGVSGAMASGPGETAAGVTDAVRTASAAPQNAAAGGTASGASAAGATPAGPQRDDND